MGKRRIWVVSTAVVLSAAVLSFLTLQHRESSNVTGWSRRSPEVVKKTLGSVVTDPVNFTKKQFQGGIGIVLSPVPQTGLPLIGSIIPESPADKAGLLEGDVILKVNGMLTTNKPFAQVASEIKGITAGFVTLTVQRSGSNCDYTIQRSSWNSLEEKGRQSNGGEHRRLLK